jgi:hypothetical protein
MAVMFRKYDNYWERLPDVNNNSPRRFPEQSAAEVVGI